MSNIEPNLWATGFLGDNLYEHPSKMLPLYRYNKQSRNNILPNFLETTYIKMQVGIYMQL